MKFDKLSADIIGCAIEVHKHLGPGLLESTYQKCLFQELRLKRISAVTEYPIAVEYKGIALNAGFRIDILVENKLIIEVKSVEKIHIVHEAQVLTYMKFANIPTALLINFNVTTLKNGLKRFVN